MNKKYLYCLLIPLLLAGCSNQNQEDNGEKIIDDSNAIVKTDVSIDFLCMVSETYLPKLQAMVNQFMIQEPHVTVNLSNPLGAGNYTVLEKNVVAGFFKNNYPDLVQCYPDNVVKYIARGYAVELDEYLNNIDYGVIRNNETDYIQSFLNEGASYPVAGTYSLPFCKSTELLYYNADALLGLQLTGINEGNEIDEEYLNNLTWDEVFDNLCPALATYNDSLPDDQKIYNKTTNSALFTYDSDENFFITLANQYGYGYTGFDESGNSSIDFDNDGMKNLMRKLKAAKDDGYLHTRGSLNNYVSELFTKKEALFTVSSTAGLSYNYSFNDPFAVGVAKIPHAAGREYSSINQGPSVCILDHKDENRSLASYLLWKFITNENNASDWFLTTGYMGIRNSCYTNEEYLKKLDTDGVTDLYELAKAENLKKIAEVSALTFNTPVFKGSGDARSNVGKLITNCLTSDDLESEIDSLFTTASEETKSHLAN